MGLYKVQEFYNLEIMKEKCFLGNRRERIEEKTAHSQTSQDQISASGQVPFNSSYPLGQRESVCFSVENTL